MNRAMFWVLVCVIALAGCAGLAQRAETLGLTPERTETVARGIETTGAAVAAVAQAVPPPAAPVIWATGRAIELAGWGLGALAGLWAMWQRRRAGHLVDTVKSLVNGVESALETMPDSTRHALKQSLLNWAQGLGVWKTVQRIRGKA